MAWLGCPHPGITRDFQRVPGLAELNIHEIGPGLGSHAVFGGRAQNMLTVLIESHAKRDVFTKQAMIPRYNVRRHFFKRVPDVRSAIGIVNRGRNVKGRIAAYAHARLISTVWFNLSACEMQEATNRTWY